MPSHALQRGWLGSRARFTAGVLDYVRGRAPEDWQGPFNKQRGRQAIFREIVDACDFSAIVETGTFRGDTTLYMHQETGLPVYSVEIHPRLYGFARARLQRFTGIQLFWMDSIAFLRSLPDVPGIPPHGLFFYLDAHWYESLPLREEVAVIFERWPDAVVMIDDFRVPDDEGYGYDDYGPTLTLSLDLLEGLPCGALRTWLPAFPSEQETGARRGVVILSRDSHRAGQIATMNLLREWLQ